MSALKHKLSDYVGRKIGNRTIIGEAGHDKAQKRLWLVTCDCGNQDKVTVANLMRGTADRCESCAIKLNSGAFCKGWKGYGKISATAYHSFRNQALRRGIDWHIPIAHLDYLYEKQKGKCALSGEPIFFKKNSRDGIKNRASLDRIDSNLGYIVGNVWLVTPDVNMAKQSFSVEHFIQLCRLVANHSSLDCNATEILEAA